MIPAPENPPAFIWPCASFRTIPSTIAPRKHMVALMTALRLVVVLSEGSFPLQEGNCFGVKAYGPLAILKEPQITHLIFRNHRKRFIVV